MCGIAGFISTKQESTTIIESMTSALKHRGPDNQGVWCDLENHLYFGHQRLSIVDLSPAGNQPMHSACGRYCIIYNGEVYNTEEIRKKLISIGKKFCGYSDTEVIVEACATWGITKTVNELIGMFAFALWDKTELTLYLVRDRLGIKPLYWGSFDGLFLFGSELKSLREHPGWTPEVDRNALSAYLRHSYVPTPHSIYKNIFKLKPGSMLTIKPGEANEIQQYWDMEQVISQGKQSSDVNEETQLQNMEDIIENAVCRRMIADVPLGAFLSGGIDSSLVVSLMQKHSDRPVKTFTIGFSEPDYNEADYAAKVAAYLGTEHNEFYVTPEDAMKVIPDLPEIYDEPFSDSSQIPTYLISKMTREHVTVALTGDGGDEVFAGYSRYFLADRLDRTINLIGRPGCKILQRSLHLCSADTWSKILKHLPARLKIPQVGDKLYKLADVLLDDKYARYLKLVSHWDKPDKIVLDSQEAKSAISENQFISTMTEYVEQMQYLDTISYLHDDILTKVDRASMAVSLEARVPLLDHRVIEYAWTLPLSMKVKNGKGKWLLRRVLEKYLPVTLIDRPKMGFGVPINSWLRGPLRDWAESLLDESKLREQGYFDPLRVREKWTEHLSGERNWQYYLWDILMFQAWHERWME
ncbi:MAG: asparagine synthase (glutamine-hydrolyzing) [Gammaproteobacteria bacterium]|jgi:asparagine synthase (glutamine-hydrolysing)